MNSLTRSEQSHYTMDPSSSSTNKDELTGNEEGSKMNTVTRSVQTHYTMDPRPDTKYTDLLKNHKYDLFGEELKKAAKNGSKNLKVLLELAEYKKFNIADKKFKPGDEILKHSVLRKMAKEAEESYCEQLDLVIENCPELLLRTFPRKGCDAEFHPKETIVHLAVALRNVKATEILLKAIKQPACKGSEPITRDEEVLGGIQVDKLLHLPVDSKLDPTMTDTCYEAELPLSMAAWNGDYAIIDILLEKFNASIEAQNTRGDNVFHSLIRMASKEGCRASESKLKSVIQMFKFLRDKCVTNIESQRRKEKYVTALLYQENNDGLTPLLLSAKLSCHKMFKLLVNTPNVYRHINAVEGISNIYNYDITEIDSSSCKKDSVLEIIMANSHEEYFQFTELSPVLDLIRKKWDVYKCWYLGWALLHLIMMVLYTLAIVPINNRGNYSASLLAIVLIRPEQNATRDSSALFPQNWVVVDIFLILYLIYVSYLLFQELYQICRLIHLMFFCHAPAGSLAINPVGNSCYRGLLIFYGLFTLASYPPYYVNSTSAHIPQTIGLVLGWSFLMFFTRALKPFSFFTVIMQLAFVDIARFVVMYLVLLIPFSGAMAILFQFSSKIAEFSTMRSSMFTMFLLTLGLSEVDVRDGATFPAMAVILYIVYLAMTYILLLNMVIALLSETCARVSSYRQSQWHLQKLGIILFIESNLHPKFRSKIGKARKQKRAQIGCQVDSEVPPTLTRQHHKSGHSHPGDKPLSRVYLEVTSMVDPKIDEKEYEPHPNIIDNNKEQGQEIEQGQELGQGLGQA